MKGLLTQKTGFVMDYQHMLGKNRLNELDFAQARGQIAKAHDAVREMIATGHIKSGDLVLFPTLPYIQADNLNSPESIQKLLDYGQGLRNNCDALISIGIGGSYLGARVLIEALCGTYWNTLSAEDRQGRPKVYFAGNNLDAEALDSLINLMIAQAKVQAGRYKVNLVVISKSGTTLENAACFMSIYSALKQQEELIELSVTVVTQQNPEGKNPLENLAKINSWPMFRVPDGVGGRFCVLTDPGLLIAAAAGLDIQEFLRGARDMQESCLNGDVWDNAALLAATCKYLAADKYGKHIEVFMPYCEKLKALAEWYVQLLAESLGKKYDVNGNIVHYSRTPLVAVGSTDMHAQTQEHQEGRDNKILQFIKINRPNKDVVVPAAFENIEFFSQFAGLSYNSLNDIALQSNAEALNLVGRFSITLSLPLLNEYYLGILMYFCMLSVAYEGELADVNAFDQPGVEVYKSFMRAQMRNLNHK